MEVHDETDSTVRDSKSEQQPHNRESDVMEDCENTKQDSKMEDVSKEKDDVDGKDDGEGGVFKAPVSITTPRMLMKKTGKVAEAFGDQTDVSTSKEGVKSVSEEFESKQRSTHEVKKFKYATPAEQIKTQEVPIPYKEPAWGTLCTENYSFEVIKNGIVIDALDLKTKSFYVFGRLPSCDVTMEHPSLSRYHAIVQYCGVESDNMHIGWYLYDLDSTHGTWVNKIKVKPRVYVRLRVGYVVKFGGSSRLNILQGPADDQDEESELSITELKAQRERQKKEAELLRQAELLEAENQKMMVENAKQDTGCSWGMDEDDEDLTNVDLSATVGEPQNEDLYIEDPKKALRGYFEREGHELPEYDVVEEGRGKYKCRVELPIDGPTGEPIIAEVTVSGKKKEAVAACALEACRILDQHGELRKAVHESRAHKKKNLEENDFYESDEDTFLDRTGDIERKRKLRMKRAGKKTEKPETYDSLVEKLSEIDRRVTEIEEKLQQAKDKTEAFEEQGLDVFDAYMMSLKAGALDTKTKMKLKRELFDLKQERKRIEKLANIAKPALPNLAKTHTTNKLGVSAMFGKMKGPAKGATKLPKPAPKTVTQQREAEEEFVEEEDEDDEEESTKVEVKSLDSGKEHINVTENQKKINPSSPDHNKQIKQRVLGPTLPASTTITMDTNDKQIEETTVTTTDDSISHTQAVDSVEAECKPDDMQQKITEKKKKNVRKNQSIVDKPAYTDMDTDPDYAVWVPPAGQTGDGKTHLNEKYGY